MTILLLSLLLLGLLLAFFHRGDDTPVVQPKGDCSTCDGSPATRCEQDCMMEAATKPVVYYDDEELDTFSGRPADAYSDDEAELFREVLFTLQPAEVAAWGRSLTLRGIALPDQLKPEYVMMVED